MMNISFQITIYSSPQQNTKGALPLQSVRAKQIGQTM